MHAPPVVDPALVDAFRRDGAVCVRGAFSEHGSRARRDRDRSQPCRAERARTRREPTRRSGPLLRGLLQLAAAARARACRPGLAGGGDRRRADGRRRGAVLPRPRAREGAGDDAAHAVAPGSALLQRRRDADVLCVASGRSGLARGDARVRCGIASRPVADAADVHGQRGEVVPGGCARGSPRHRERSFRLRDHRLGARAGRRRLLQHADAPLRGRGRRATSPSGAVAALPRRRRDARTASVEDVARLPGACGRARRGRADGSSAVPASCGSGSEAARNRRGAPPER